MKTLFCVTALSIALAGATMAHQGVSNPNVKAWMHAMGHAGDASKTLGNMAKGKVPFDASIAKTAKAQLIDVSLSFPKLFEVNAADPVSEALPAIWEDYSDFIEKAEAMTAAAKALDVSSPTAIGQSLKTLGGTCRSCHKAYRK